MAGKIMSFIDNANRVMLFVVALFVIWVICYQAVSRLTRDNVEQSTVSVVDSDKKEEIQAKTIKNYLGKLKDVHIFEIAKDMTLNKDGSIKKADYSRYSASGISANALNLLFTKAGEKAQLLLTSNALIYKFSKVQENQDNGHLLSKNLYLLVKSDTNNDGVLDGKDRRDFYISDYDGDNLTLMKENINHYKIIDNDTLLVHSTSENDERLFELFNVYTGAFELLDTQL